jgi:hypothetical protein
MIVNKLIKDEIQIIIYFEFKSVILFSYIDDIYVNKFYLMMDNKYTNSGELIKIKDIDGYDEEEDIEVISIINKSYTESLNSEDKTVRKITLEIILNEYKEKINKYIKNDYT